MLPVSHMFFNLQPLAIWAAMTPAVEKLLWQRSFISELRELIWVLILLLLATADTVDHSLLLGIFFLLISMKALAELCFLFILSFLYKCFFPPYLSFKHWCPKDVIRGPLFLNFFYVISLFYNLLDKLGEVLWLKNKSKQTENWF